MGSPYLTNKVKEPNSQHEVFGYTLYLCQDSLRALSSLAIHYRYRHPNIVPRIRCIQRLPLEVALALPFRPQFHQPQAYFLESMRCLSILACLHIPPGEVDMHLDMEATSDHLRVYFLLKFIQMGLLFQ